MKLVTFVEGGAERLGFLAGDAVVDPLLASGDQARCSPKRAELHQVRRQGGSQAARAIARQSSEAGAASRGRT